MRLDRLSVAAAVVAAAAPCVWLAGCVDAQDTIESSVQQRTDAGGTPPGGGGTPENENPQPQPEGPTSSCGPSVLYNRTIDASRYKFGCPEIEAMMAGPKVYIAGGNSREVFLINHEGEQLVLKVSKHQSDHQSTRHLMEAIALDVVLGAPYIAPSLGFCGTSSVQPFFEGGTVEERIFEGAWTGKPIGMPAVLQMSLEAMRGLQVLHEAPGGPIIHNAMRPEQLLVYGNGTVVVSDLNSCNFMGVDSGGEPCRTRSDIHHNPRWNAPELYSDEGYSEKVDIFSMGIVFWQLLALRSVPFEGHHRHEIHGLVVEDQRPFVDPSWDPSYAQLIQDMWETDPEARPSSREVVARLEEIMEEAQ